MSTVDKPFIPHKVENKIRVEIFESEARLLSQLREHSFGQIIVYKANGILTRIEVKDSKIINDDIEIKL